MALINKTELQEALDFGAFYPASIQQDDRLYHYTTSAGMEGIMSSGKLWATDYRFLNDCEEFGLLGERMEQVVKSLHLHPAYEKRVWELLSTKLDRNSKDQDGRGSYFVTCFSVDPDSLLLWSEFADIRGCNLGFDNSDMIECCYAQGAKPGMVIYTEAEQMHWMTECFEQLMERGESAAGYLMALCRQGQYGELHAYLDCVALLATYYSMYFKREIFEGEKEYRFILHDSGKSDILYRQKGSLRIPYIELPICDVGAKIPLREVHLNPKLHDATERQRFEELLDGYDKVELIESKANLRY